MVLKPLNHEGTDRFSIINGAWQADDRGRLIELYRDANDAVAGKPVIAIQEMVPGARGAHFSYATLCKDGQVVASVSGMRDRLLPVDFGSSAFVSVNALRGSLDANGAGRVAAASRGPRACRLRTGFAAVAEAVGIALRGSGADEISLAMGVGVLRWVFIILVAGVIVFLISRDRAISSLRAAVQALTETLDGALGRIETLEEAQTKKKRRIGQSGSWWSGSTTSG